MYKDISVTTVVCGADMCCMRLAAKRRVTVLETKCTKNGVGMTSMVRVRDDEVCRMARMEKRVAKQI